MITLNRIVRCSLVGPNADFEVSILLNADVKPPPPPPLANAANPPLTGAAVGVTGLGVTT